MSRLRCIALIAAVAALGGCSLVRLAYDNADRLAVMYADRWFDLDRVQKRALRDAMRLRLVEHRRDELPQYTTFLRRARRMSEGSATPDDFEWLFAESRRLFELGFERSLAAYCTTLASLSEDQVSHFAAELDEMNAEYAEELGEGPERREARIRRLTREVEDWTGRLRPAQRALLEGLIDRVPDTARGWTEFRLRRQQALLAALRARRDAAALERLLAEWWLDDTHVSPALARQWEANRALYAAGLAELTGTLDQRQRERIAARLDGLIEDLDALAADDAAQVPVTALVDPSGGLFYKRSTAP